MRKLFGLVLAGLFCLGAAMAAVYLILAPPRSSGGTNDRSRLSRRIGPATEAVLTRASTRGDLDARGKSREIFLDHDKIEDGGFGMASQYTGSIHDPRSLGDLREAVQARGRVGLAVLRAECDELRIGPRTAPSKSRTRAGSGASAACSRCTRAVSPRRQTPCRRLSTAAVSRKCRRGRA